MLLPYPEPADGSSTPQLPPLILSLPNTILRPRSVYEEGPVAGSPKGKAQKTDADSSVRSSAKKPAPQVHFNVECDSCGIRPIRGARYRSLVSMRSLRVC